MYLEKMCSNLNIQVTGGLQYHSIFYDVDDINVNNRRDSKAVGEDGDFKASIGRYMESLRCRALVSRTNTRWALDPDLPTRGPALHQLIPNIMSTLYEYCDAFVIISIKKR